MFPLFSHGWPPLPLPLLGRVPEIGLHLMRLRWVVPGCNPVGVLLRSDEVRAWVEDARLMIRDQWWLFRSIAREMGSRRETRTHDGSFPSFGRTGNNIRTAGQKNKTKDRTATEPYRRIGCGSTINRLSPLPASVSR